MRHNAAIALASVSAGRLVLALGALARAPLPAFAQATHAAGGSAVAGFAVAETEPRYTLSIRRAVRPNQTDSAVSQWIPQVAQVAEEQGRSLAGPPFVRIYGVLPSNELDLEVGFPVTGRAQDAGSVRGGLVQGGPVALTVTIGGPDTVNLVLRALSQWAEAAGWVVCGPAWRSYLTDPSSSLFGEAPRTEIRIPLRRRVAR